MSSYRQVYYHIVFGTKFRAPAINPDHELDLFKYIWGVVKKNKCVLHQLNGMPDHIHILSDLHPSVSLSNFIKDIKVSSSMWVKDTGRFPLFTGWQEGYGAFSCSDKEKDFITGYIKGQKEHHKKENFKEEYMRLLHEHRVRFEEKYLF